MVTVLGRQRGELDDITAHNKAERRMQLPQDKISDVSNIDPDGSIITEADPLRISSARKNVLWHAEGAYNTRRSGISILRAVESLPRGMGGETESLDSRTAHEDLSDESKGRTDTSWDSTHCCGTENKQTRIWTYLKTLTAPKCHWKSTRSPNGTRLRVKVTYTLAPIIITSKA